MSEQTTQAPEVQEVAAPEVDYKALAEKLQADLEAVVAKKEELYRETKQAKAQKAEAEAAALKAAKEKAAKDGEFEKLWQTSEAEKSELQKKLESIVHSNRREKIQIAALKISNELAEGDNVELLSDFVTRNLDKLADETGVVNPDVLAAVKQEFAQNAKFKSLLRGSKAAGGGAIGNAQGANISDSKTVDRSTFFKWSPDQQMKYIKNGGVLTN